VPGHRRDDKASAAPRDHIAELLEHERGTVKIDSENRRRRCLRRGDTRSVDDAADVPERRGCLDERADRLARGHVDGSGAYLEPGIAKGALENN
jgi:hypothetical protein